MTRNCTNWLREIEPLRADYRHAVRQVQDETLALKEAEARVLAALEAQRLVNEVAQAVQESAHKQIASVVTRCLKSVFGEDAPGFRIAMERKRGRTEAELLFIKDGKDLDPVGSSGGGVVDVAGFALRLAALILSVPKNRRLLVLDEPMKMLSKNYIPAIRDLILILAQELQVQIILVTHNRDLEIGKVIDLGGGDG